MQSVPRPSYGEATAAIARARMPGDAMLDDFIDFDQDVIKLLDQVSGQSQGNGVENDEHGLCSATPFVLANPHSDFDYAVFDDFAALEEPLTRREGGKRSRVAAASSISTGSAGAESPNSKLREKNRLAQARFRQKKKHEKEQLERQVVEMTETIAAVRATIPQRQVQKSQLMERNYVAASALLQVCSRGNISVGMAPAMSAPEPSASASVSASAAESWYAPNAQASVTAPSVSAVARRARFGSPTLSAMPSGPRAVATYAYHAGLSFSDLGVSLGGLSLREMLPNLSMHLRSTRAALATRMHCRASDVCWHLQSVYAAAPGLPLSFSSQLGSPMCNVSFFICWLLELLEFAFLTDERDQLSALLPDSAQSSQHASCTSDVGSIMSLSSMTSALYAPPLDSGQSGEPRCDVSSGTLCRCGVNQTCPLTAAVPFALLGLLAKYARRVPARAFFLRCDQFHRFAASIRPLVGKPSDPAGSGEEEDDGSGHVPLAAIVQGMHAVLQCMAAAHTEAIASYRASPEVVGAGLANLSEDDIGAAMARNGSDMVALADAHCLAMQTVFLENKKRIRQLSLAVCIPSHVSFAEIEHVNVVTYEALGITRDQAAAMRTLWQRVNVHRSAINTQYAALASSMVAIPSAAGVPHEFLRALAALCAPATAAAAAAAAAAAEEAGIGASFAAPCAPGRHDWARFVLGASGAATAAAVSGMERLWATLEDEMTAQSTFAAMARYAPCLSREQSARFCAEQLARGAFVVDVLRMCQLAAQEMRRGLLFEGRLR